VFTFIGGALFAYFTIGSKSSNRLMFGFFASIAVTILLVLPLHFYQLQFSENDRYGSLMAPFVGLLLAYIFYKIQGISRYIVLGSYLLVNIIFQQGLVSNWVNSEGIIQTHVNSYSSKTGKTLMLNLPENFNGTYMFRDYRGENPLPAHMKIYGIDISPVDLVTQYNIPNTSFTLKANWVADNKIRVESQSWGSWWWKAGKGIDDYKTEKYTVDFTPKYFEVTLLDSSYYEHIMYSDGRVFLEL